MAETESFRGVVRYFHPERASGLAVVDLPAEVTQALGGLKQVRVRGRLNGVDFRSNVMPAGNGVLALSLSRALLASSALSVGDEVQVEVERDA